MIYVGLVNPAYMRFSFLCLLPPIIGDYRIGMTSQRQRFYTRTLYHKIASTFGGHVACT